uniref:Uncharacterized protein n=1 Tax=Opuntia streptacantha TaxID=393608 RepID=A0A7C9DQ60_OPUST
MAAATKIRVQMGVLGLGSNWTKFVGPHHVWTIIITITITITHRHKVIGTDLKRSKTRVVHLLMLIEDARGGRISSRVELERVKLKRLRVFERRKGATGVGCWVEESRDGVMSS